MAVDQPVWKRPGWLPLRGHQVTLYEKGSKLGGLLPLAALVKGTEVEDLTAIINYFKTNITSLGVDIKLGKEFTASMAAKLKPDVVILAAGGTSVVPSIPGIESSRKVVSGPSSAPSIEDLPQVF